MVYAIRPICGNGPDTACVNETLTSAHPAWHDRDPYEATRGGDA